MSSVVALYYKKNGYAVRIPVAGDTSLLAGTGVTVSEDTDTGATTVGVDTDTILTTEAAAENYLPRALLNSDQTLVKAVVGQNTGATLRCNSDDSKVCITSSSSGANASGGSLTLLGSGYSGTDRAAGSFVLRAHDGTNQVSLLGLPDGSLTWNGKAVLLEGDLPARHRSSTTAAADSASGADFTTPAEYTLGAHQVSVWWNGIYLAEGLQFTEVDSSTININVALEADDVVSIEVLK